MRRPWSPVAMSELLVTYMELTAAGLFRTCT